MTIHIQEHGQGRPIVLFHGWGFDSQIWMPLVYRLNDSRFQYKLYLVDLPGFGRTPEMSWEDFKTALLVKLPDSFAVLGWSMGGLFATRLLAEEPNRVVQLINVASSPRFIIDDNWTGIKKEVFNDFYNNFLENPTKTRLNFIKSQLKTANITKEMVGLETPILGLKSGLDWLINWDLRPLLLEFKKPVLYIFGKLDTIVPRKTMKIMQSEYPDFKYLMFDKSAHMPFISNLDDFVDLLAEVLI